MGYSLPPKASNPFDPSQPGYETWHKTTEVQRVADEARKAHPPPPNSHLCPQHNLKAREYIHHIPDDAVPLSKENTYYKAATPIERQEAAWEYIRIASHDAPSPPTNYFKIRLRFRLSIPAVRNLLQLWDWVSLSGVPDVTFEYASREAARVYGKRTWRKVTENQMADLLNNARTELNTEENSHNTA